MSFRILLVFALTLLCIGVGSLVVMRSRYSGGLMAWCGLRGLAGFFVLAGALNVFATLHVSRPVVLVACVVAAICGLSSERWGGGRWPRPRMHDLLFLAGAVGLMATPVTMVFASPMAAHDAVMTWLPKAESWVRGAEFEALNEIREWHPLYPRGGSAVAGLLAGDVQEAAFLLRFLSIIVLAFAGGAITFVGESSGHPFVGVLAALSPLAIPELIAFAPTGYMDITVGVAVIGAAVGFSIARVEPIGFVYAGLAGASAMACKQEGVVVGLAVLLMLIWAAVRTRSLKPAVMVLPVAVFAVPWLILSEGGATWAVEALDVFIDHPARLFERLLAVAERHGRLFHESLPPDAESSGPAFGPYISFWAILAWLFAWFLRPRRCFGLLPTFPALFLVAAHLAVLSITYHSLSWQIANSTNRLSIQVAPLLLASAVLRLGSRPMQTSALKSAYLSVQPDRAVTDGKTTGLEHGGGP